MYRRTVSPSCRSSAVSPLGLMLEDGALVVTYWWLYNARKVRSVRHVINSMKTEKKIGSNLNVFPGQIPRRFLKSDCEMLQTSSISSI